MSEDVEGVVRRALVGLDDDILSYLVSSIDGMSPAERRSFDSLVELVQPFLVDAGFCDESSAVQICRQLTVSFGGSGYKSQSIEEELPQLLSNPVKIIERTDLIKAKATYGSYVPGDINTKAWVPPSPQLEIATVPVTQRQARKMRKENEMLSRLLRQEQARREREAEELRMARMAAIRASRAVGRQANAGVNIERFSLAHPSGTGELLTDAALVMSRHRRYGLIGKNGAGKSTLLRALANYRLPGILHLKILLVDQHVEGDQESALAWVLRSDVERTALLEDEQKIIANLHGDLVSEELRGVDLDLALAECYERMDAIGVNTAEFRARRILEGLGFTESTISAPTESLSGGWAMRAALASAIYNQPDLLLLDEPTNHLDLHALVWLERWLVYDFEGIALVVSHDTCFLNEICTDILELRSTLANQSSSSLIHYNGDYNTYQKTLREKKIAQARAREAFEVHSFIVSTKLATDCLIDATR